MRKKALHDGVGVNHFVTVITPKGALPVQPYHLHITHKPFCLVTLIGDMLRSTMSGSFKLKTNNKPTLNSVFLVVSRKFPHTKFVHASPCIYFAPSLPAGSFNYPFTKILVGLLLCSWNTAFTSADVQFCDVASCVPAGRHIQAIPRNIQSQW